jgi:hypothetical protein
MLFGECDQIPLPFPECDQTHQVVYEFKTRGYKRRSGGTMVIAGYISLTLPKEFEMSANVRSIEMAHGNIWLCERGVYPYSSVLHGQEFRQLMRPYDSVEAAVAENPGVVVDLEGQRPPVFIPQKPPEDFDPADCGEHWSEDY